MWFRAALALLLLCAPPTQAETSAAPGLVQSILEAQRIPFELVAIQGAALQELSEQRGRVRAQDRARIELAVEVGFDPDTLLARVREEVLAAFDLEHAARAAEWLATSEHRRLYAVTHGATADCLETLSLAELRTHLTSRRAPLVLDVARGTGALGREIRRGTLVFAALVLAGNAALPPEQRFSGEQVQLLIESQHSTLATRYPSDLRALHCALRDVPDARLEEAVSFYESPAGRWLQDATRLGLERALVSAATDTARAIVDLFETESFPASSASYRGEGRGVLNPLRAQEPATRASVLGRSRSRTRTR